MKTEQGPEKMAIVQHNTPPQQPEGNAAGTFSQPWPTQSATRPHTGQAPASVREAGAQIFLPLVAFTISTSALLVLAALIVSSPHVAGEVTIPSYVLRPALDRWEELLLGAWQHWDGLWYLKIAAQGYDYFDYSLAFFPFYPLLVRVVASLLNINHLLAGVLVSIASYLVALQYLYRLARLEIGEDGARRSVIYLAIFPTSFFFLAVYTESVFLALTLAAFYYARRGRWAWVGVLGLLASLTRSTGVLLLLPLIVEYLQQRQMHRGEIRADAMNLLLIPGGTILYAAYSLLAFGDALAFARAQEHWERGFAFPWHTLSQAWNLAIVEGNIPLVTQPDGSPLYEALYISNLLGGHAVNLAFFALGAILTLFAFRRLRLTYALYATLALALPLFNPSEMTPLLSIPRFVLVIFPLFFVLATIGKGRTAHRIIVATSVVGLLMFLLRFASWYWVA